MKQKSRINGTEYTFLESLPVLGKESLLILCADNCGNRALCPEELWHNGEVCENQVFSINTHSSAQQKIKFFLSLFRGRENVYARRYFSVKTGKSGYTPVCKNEWQHGLCDKKEYRCPNCPNREFLPLAAETVKAHLMGCDPLCRDVIAIYPMLEDNTTYLLAADFDEASWQADVSAFCKCCNEYGLTPAVERSRSGNGAHVWFFFSEPVPAADARRMGSSLLTKTMARRHELSFSSYDRLFPTQDTVPKGGFGNLIALPFQGQAQRNGNTLFVNEQFVPHPDQWAFLFSLPQITPEQLSEYLIAAGGDGDIGVLADDSERTPPWQRKNVRKHLTRSDFPDRVNLIMTNLLYIEKTGFSQAALNVLKRLAAFSNPEFRSKQAMRLPIYGTPRILDCGYEDDTYIGLPRGCGELAAKLLEQYEVPVITEDRRYGGKVLDVSFSGTLRPEQEPAAQALLVEDSGVLSATTAFGKTVIGAYLIGQRKVNTLILVQSSALLEQWKSSLEQFLNIHEVLPELPKKRGRKKQRSLIGQIGAGKDTHSGIIDIAIMQSLFEGEEKDVKPFVADYGMVIVDECHHVAAFTFEKVLKAVEAKYVYGLSATPVRKDGHHPIIFMQCGPIRYLVDAKSQAEKRAFSHFVIPRFTHARASEGNSIQDLYAAIIKNGNRNVLLVEDAINLVRAGRSPILLTERKEHAAQLAMLLKPQVQNVFLMVGSDKPKEKREKLDALHATPANEEVVVVATGKYIGEGFNAPRLDTLLLAMPISWKGTLAQYAGRLHRNYEGKHEVRIYDYVDIRIPMLERMYHKRLKGYADLGYQVKFGAADERVSMIYNGHTAMSAFEQDLSDAARSIIIVSPFLQQGRVKRLLPLLRDAVLCGVKVMIYTVNESEADEARRVETATTVELLKEANVDVVLRKELAQRYAVIDGSIVWYGSVDLLAFGRKDADVLRFENADIAGDLLALNDESMCEQLIIQDVQYES